MNSLIEVIISILMLASMVVLMLEAISHRSIRSSLNEKAHIRLVLLGVIIVSLFLIITNLITQKYFDKNPGLLIDYIATCFLMINTIIAIKIGNKTLNNKQDNYVFFIILSALTISITNIWSDYLILKVINSTGWLILMATLAVKTTSGGKKAEIGLKLSFSATTVFLLLLLALYFITYSSHISDLANIRISKMPADNMALLGITFFILASLNLMGIAPFSFAHIDCADGTQMSTAFLLMSNAAIQGASHLLDAKAVLNRSDLIFSKEINIIGFILSIGLIIAWIRALDQSKIRRTIAYIASTTCPVFCLSLIFGASELLPRVVFIIAIFAFLSLSLFVIFGSLAYMDNVNHHWQTWEDIAGFGRTNKIPSLYLLIALASVTGLPGTLGYFIKLSLIAPMRDNFFFSSAIFISIALGAACTMRMFVFLFSKHSVTKEISPLTKTPPISLMISALVLIILGLFPFVR